MNYTDEEIAHLNKRAREVANKRGGQSKRHSWYETLTGTSTGFLGSLLIMYLVMTYMSGSVALKSLVTTLLCTVWSIVRGYYNRRFWNWVHTR